MYPPHAESEEQDSADVAWAHDAQGGSGTLDPPDYTAVIRFSAESV
jgi:hypothetical protein